MTKFIKGKVYKYLQDDYEAQIENSNAYKTVCQGDQLIYVRQEIEANGSVFVFFLHGDKIVAFYLMPNYNNLWDDIFELVS